MNPMPSLNVPDAIYSSLLNGKNDPIELLKDKVILKNTLAMLKWYDYGDYLGDQAVDVITDFIERYPDIMLGYFNGTCNLDEIGNKVITYIYNNNFHFDRDRLFECVAEYERKTTDFVTKIACQHDFDNHIKILGFGIRDGYFERHIRETLIKHHKIKDADIYGYDPNVSAEFPIITLTHETLYSRECPKFDLVIARWVLHHVEMKSRWDALAQCLNQLGDKGKVIIVEEGLFRDDGSYPLRIYNFLLCVADIIINFALNTSWMVNIAESREPPFYVKYLSSNDIKSIENGFQLELSRKTTVFDEFFMPQTIIEYQVTSVQDKPLSTMKQRAFEN